MSQDPINDPPPGEHYRYDPAVKPYDDGNNYSCKWHYITSGFKCCPAAKVVRGREPKEDE